MEDNTVTDWERMPMDARIDAHERMHSKSKQWRAIVNASITGNYDGFNVSQQLKSDLAWLNERLLSCHAEQLKSSEYNQALGLIQAQIADSPMHERPPLIARRNELQECCTRCNDAIQFMSNLNYAHPEFFQDCIPLIVIARREAEQAKTEFEQAIANAERTAAVEPTATAARPTFSVGDLLRKTKSAI